ncbi:MAG: hypothetical protein GY822_20325 [Deltaproteobacteria bacterium]|nr:hypothetical protein [Deltaproteobacteria bacterium]
MTNLLHPRLWQNYCLKSLVAASSLAVVCSFAQPLHAQEAPAKKEASSLLDSKVAPKPAAGESAKTPTADMESKASSWVGEMKTKYDEGLQLVRDAKKEADPLKQICVSDKISLMKGVLRIASNASSTLSENLANGQDASARRQLRKIETNRSKMLSLSNQAKSCAGASSSFVSKSEVEFETSDDLNKPESYYADSSHFTNSETRVVDGNTGTVGESDPSVPDALPPVSLSSE